MGKVSWADIRKAWYYLEGNGLIRTFYAVKENLEARQKTYYFEPVSEDDWEKQREWSMGRSLRFSIVVPTYRTNEVFLLDMLRSVQDQSYPHWELILVDATENDSVRLHLRSALGEMLEEIEYGAAESECSWMDGRVRYVHLIRNSGISENTNRGLAYAMGDYIGLLDHDDVLTVDALYEMAAAVEAGREKGNCARLLYSDEDKCNSERTEYFEPHFKEDFNLDLILTNNYICHFMVMESEMIKRLKLRPKYDGAQDFDLVLRAVEELMDSVEKIVHIPKVLYHWRCHADSTAENPKSKEYAYEAGREAVQDFMNVKNIRAIVLPYMHNGYYHWMSQNGPLRCRKDVAAIGGGLYVRNRLVGGRMSMDGEVFYKGLPRQYSGYMHRAILQQSAEALDIRMISVREECWEIFEQVTGVPYREIKKDRWFDVSTLPAGTDYQAVSLALSKALREKGYRLLYTPRRRAKWRPKMRRIKPMGGSSWN